MWILIISKHIMASNKPDSTLSPLRFNFPFPPSCSSYTPPLLSPLPQLLLWGFISFSQTSFSLLFHPPPNTPTQIRDDPTCMYTKHAYAWKWLKAEMHTVHGAILGLNRHMHAAFCRCSMDRLGAWNENPLNQTFFTFPCILSRLRESLAFSKKMSCF